MSTSLAAIGGFTDEQRDFRAAIRDFCERELGTKEQRERLTNGYTELHNQEIYEKLAELGWLGVSIDEEYGGSGGGMVDACIFLEETMRGLVPIAGYGVSLIVAGAYERFGTEEQKAGDPRRDHPRAGRGDRDVRARGGLGRRQPLLPGRAPERRLRPQRPEDLDLGRPHRRPHPGHRPLRHLGLQARGPDDALGPDRRRGDRDPRDRDDGRQGGQRRLPHRLLRAGGARARPGRRRLDAADGGPQRRAPDPRRERARDRPARLRRRARLRQGAQAVRPPDRLLPGAQAPDRRPRDRDRVHPAARLRRRPQGRRRPRPSCSRARRRWRS